MCDQDHIVTFNSRECEIKKEGLGKLVATGTTTPNNIYILDNFKKEKCYLGKIDECWIWNRRMGDVNFKNFIKLSKEHAIRNMLALTNPLNSNCKHR